MSFIPVLWKLKQETDKIKASLGYIETCLKTSKKQTNKQVLFVECLSHFYYCEEKP